jgi:hypothetical protein
VGAELKLFQRERDVEGGHSWNFFPYAQNRIKFRGIKKNTAESSVEGSPTQEGITGLRH